MAEPLVLESLAQRPAKGNKLVLDSRTKKPWGIRKQRNSDWIKCDSFVRLRGSFWGAVCGNRLTY